jgi:chemotaxis protein methyltransferase CheR
MSLTEDQDFAFFVQKLKDYTGIDLNLYKEAQMKRRLTTLRGKKGFATFAAYLDAITKDKDLLNELLDRMTINVSEFWRNPNRWEMLENKFLPDMLRSSRRLKCWSAACSTGEEPYTLAMILNELKALPEAQILATDIDLGVLDIAKTGIFPERSVRDVPARYRSYFREEQMTFLISDTLKRFIKFQKQNLLADSFDSNFDLIICRNVMIYFTEEAKHLLYQKFAQSLRPGGVLFVGSTEQIFSPGQYQLEAADTFFYRKL